MMIIVLMLIFVAGLLVCLIVSVPTGRGGIQPKTDPKPNPPKGPKL